jgi:CRISPR-associated protein Csd1
MSLLNALYNTYNTALENNMVDRTDVLNQQTILLPVYHSNKRSAGAYDLVEVTLSENSKFIKAEFVPKDQIVIFPVTENSIIRSGSKIAPHPLCDELSYLSKEFDSEKHQEYINVLNDWLSYMEAGHSNHLLKVVSEYLRQETILNDCIASLFSGSDYIVESDYSIVLNPGEKSKKIVQLEKTFVTFTIETELSTQANLSVGTDSGIHQNYINYIREKNLKLPKEKCDISGEETYCVSRHRGLMGNAKLISISNHNETYFGRFNEGEEIVHIGYEVSQKIHLMLKYFLENIQNRKKIGESCFLINWFSDDIGNKESVILTNTISPYDDMDDEDDDDSNLKTFGGIVSSAISDYMTGKKRDINPDGKFYIMILDKISNGRISVKYFRELPKADLFQRIEEWYNTTNWSFFRKKLLAKETPSLFRYADAIFGMENEKGYIECKNSKLRTKTVERLLPCILEKKRLPLDLKGRMFENLCNRNSYNKTWNYVLSIGCSIFKKYQMDYQNKSEVRELLDSNNKNRSYLYGRLLAIYEKMEKDTLRGSGSEEKRATNAERLWTAYTKTPARTLRIIEEKVRPYKERLKKSNLGSVIYYDKLLTDIVNELSNLTNFNQEKNRALNEDFIFGYYAQIQEFYKKNENGKEREE